MKFSFKKVPKSDAQLFLTDNHGVFFFVCLGIFILFAAAAF
jgi:hypothetical protein